MKVQELRSLLSKSDRVYIEKAFVESYKQLSKRQKEEIDSVLIDILEGKQAEKKKETDVADFEVLEGQIRVFIENAYAQNYFAPNRVIPKSQRPKWRFMVKNFIKELEKISPENENHEKAVKLLADLYRLICEACNYYLFSTEDPFRSIGWAQPKLFQLLVKKTFAAGYSRENISKMLLYAATGGLSRESLHIQQEIVLLSELKTSDVKQIAMEEARKLIDDRTGKIAAMGKYDNRMFDLKEAVNELCAMILLISMALGEWEEGAKYYFKNTRNYSREITLYCALELAGWMEEDEVWIKIYEYGLSKKIKPRESLIREYEERTNRITSKT